MGKKLTVYLIDGKEFGPRIIEIGNWVGKGFYCSRASLTDIYSRDEFNNPGVYFLKSQPASSSFNERIYIGEAENIGNRIRRHLSDSNRDFYELIFFISKDELLTKTQIKYLESRLIQIAIEAKTAEIENGNSPSLPTLHEADISDMEYFLEQIKLVLPLVGFNFLKSTTTQLSTKAKLLVEKNTMVFKIKNKQYTAKMFVTSDGFIVEKNSQANKKVSESMSDNYKQLRQRLIETGVLIDKGERYVFDSDTIFTSPSAASNIVLGRQSQGPSEWITADNKTYKEFVEKYESNGR
jgi:hypothetical protein